MKRDNVHIVGGGIVGLCTAWYLRKEGCEVTIIDNNTFSEGTSFGNAGMIVPSHFVPMATPGVIAKGLKWMLNSKSPFYIKPRLNTELLHWLWHFYHSAKVRKVNDAMPVLYALNEWSKSLYKAMSAEECFDFGFEEKGLLMLYKTRRQAEEEEELAEKACHLGVEANIYDNADLRSLEPDMDLDVLGGIYFPGDAHLHPNKLMEQLVTHLKQKGVQFISSTSIVDFKTSGSVIEALIDKNQRIVPVKNVVLSAGSWTRELLLKAGTKVHLQAGKGYSITLEKPPSCPRLPTILSEAKVAITPMGDNLRVGGTLELGNLSRAVNRKRVQGISESIPAYYKNLLVPPVTNSANVWAGYRPCTPDGLPYIGKAKTFSNLFIGTGHGMMGLSLGAATGKLISELLTNQQSTMSIEPFRIDRF